MLLKKIIDVPPVFPLYRNVCNIDTKYQEWRWSELQWRNVHYTVHKYVRQLVRKAYKETVTLRCVRATIVALEMQ
jgi:hypothetical protein